MKSPIQNICSGKQLSSWLKCLTPGFHEITYSKHMQWEATTILAKKPGDSGKNETFDSGISRNHLF